MLAEQRETNTANEQRHPNRLLDYKRRREVPGRLVYVMAGVPPYSNGHGRWHILKTPEAVEKWRCRYDEATKQMLKETSLR